MYLLHTHLKKYCLEARCLSAHATEPVKETRPKSKWDLGLADALCQELRLQKNPGQEPHAENADATRGNLQLLRPEGKLIRGLVKNPNRGAGGQRGLTQEHGSVEELGQEKAWRASTEMRAKDDGNKPRNQRTKPVYLTTFAINVKISSRRHH